MTPLDAWDMAVLRLALDFLRHHADVSLATARAQHNIRKQSAFLALRAQIAVVRTKLHAMQVSP
ncbi:hypothetical protein [Steroidobacter cummioxidans]|uniref:hypothetical protein n=1 Tax=Steroidobacter cummioxidans TaxID=1803913 RepID=UPI000E323DBD|nr:hypothetical protein [Steroidobacter cummioxidans]